MALVLSPFPGRRTLTNASIFVCRVKRLRDEAEKKYVHCTIDGRKEKLGNFRVEPPGLFRGRGEHPKKGTLKVSRRILTRPLSCASPTH